MALLTSIRDGLKTNLETISGLTAINNQRQYGV